MNIDKIVLQDLIGNDIVPKKSKLLGKFRCFFKSVIHNCYDDLSFFPLFFVLFFVYGLECFFFFSQMIRCNTNIVRGELIDGFCVNNWLWQAPNIQLTKLYGKF